MLRSLLVALILLAPSKICRAETLSFPRWEEVGGRACYDLDGAKKLKIFEAVCIGLDKKYSLLVDENNYQEQRTNDLLAAVDILNSQIWVLKDRVSRDSNLIDSMHKELREERSWSLRDGAKWPVIIGATAIAAAAFFAGMSL